MQSTSIKDKLLSPSSKLEGRIFGIDEAGRGAMAGPLAVAAVEWPWPAFLPNSRIKDSKSLSPSARDTLYGMITKHCKYAVIMLSPEFIDQEGIQAAETSGLLQCISQLASWDNGVFAEPNYPDLIVADGNRATWGLNDKILGKRMEARLHFMIKGDKYVPAISAASIVAKVHRDNFMKHEMHAAYPNYRFDLHVGYVTPLHLAKLDEYGSCAIHRHSFGPVKERDAHNS